MILFVIAALVFIGVLLVVAYIHNDSLISLTKEVVELNNVVQKLNNEIIALKSGRSNG